MGKKKTSKNTNDPNRGKPFPIGLALLLILLFSCTAVAACISLGFVIDALIKVITEGERADMLAVCILAFAVLTAVLLVLLYVLIRHRDTEKKNRFTENFRDDVIIVFIFMAIGAAVTLFTLENKDIEFLIALAIFPAVGIISTPNAVRYALKDMEKWEKIFYGNGNLHRCKEDKNFYKVKTPVSFERKLFWAVLKNQVLDHATVIFLMLLIVNAGIVRMVNGKHQAAPGLIGAIVHVKIERSAGFLFFALVFIAAFGIPILAYYFTNAACRLRVVKKHKYIAYHAVVKSVRSYKICINDGGRHYTYKYTTCVGIREKNIHDTKAILIFIPDDVLVFPDREQQT